jgi:hypothetical protein
VDETPQISGIPDLSGVRGQWGQFFIVDELNENRLSSLKRRDHFEGERRSYSFSIPPLDGAGGAKNLKAPDIKKGSL